MYLVIPKRKSSKAHAPWIYSLCVVGTFTGFFFPPEEEKWLRLFCIIIKHLGGGILYKKNSYTYTFPFITITNFLFSFSFSSSQLNFLDSIQTNLQNLNLL